MSQHTFSHLIGFILCASAVTGCAAATSDSDSEPDTQTQQEALQGGCRMICPHCNPNEICPMIACTLDCHDPPVHCVENMLCPIGYTWSQGACSCIPGH